VAAAVAYGERIRAALPDGSRFTPLLTAYLTDTIAAEEIARGHAEVQAAALIKDLNSEVHRSAKHTLSALAKGFGAQHVSFEFEPSTVVDLNVGMAQAVQA